MACIDEVVAGFHPKEGVRYTYTAVNEFMTRLDLCDVFIQRNNNRTQAQQIASWQVIIDKSVAAGVETGGIGPASNAFGSNWTGEHSLEERMN